MLVNMQVKEFVIPDHLRLLPTDSEEDKARKRKKVKHLKAQWKQRHAGALEAQEEAQGGGGSWKDYLNKSKKKGAAAKGLGALKKGSIFASPDTVGGEWSLSSVSPCLARLSCWPLGPLLCLFLICI